MLLSIDEHPADTRLSHSDEEIRFMVLLDVN
jgi:hypothetical protein